MYILCCCQIGLGFSGKIQIALLLPPQAPIFPTKMQRGFKWRKIRDSLEGHTANDKIWHIPWPYKNRHMAPPHHFIIIEISQLPYTLQLSKSRASKGQQAWIQGIANHWRRTPVFVINLVSLSLSLIVLYFLDSRRTFFAFKLGLGKIRSVYLKPLFSNEDAKKASNGKNKRFLGGAVQYTSQWLNMADPMESNSWGWVTTYTKYQNTPIKF